MDRITQPQIDQLSAEFELEPKALGAVFKVESSGAGFDPKTGAIKIQFEPYWFQKYTGKRIANGVENQDAEWKAYNEAVKIDANAAMKSTSWGLGQVMGFNHVAAGFDTVQEMVTAFKTSELEQFKGMLTFIKANPKMYNALQKKDWPTFARYYNGPKYKEFNYDIRLEKAYNSL